VVLAPDAPLASSIRLSQHPDQHRSKRPVLLTVDQELGEGAALRIAPKLADPVGSSMSESIRTGEPVGATTMLLEAQDAVTLFI
jgi:hypothetical protein